jgi:hypothetical protein
MVGGINGAVENKGLVPADARVDQSCAGLFRSLGRGGDAVGGKRGWAAESREGKQAAQV